MEKNKTVSKRALKSVRLEEDTVKPFDPKYKSQVIPESTSFYKEEQVHTFSVFPDAKIGLKNCEMPSIPMGADEDCKTTSSIQRHGKEACLYDLEKALRMPREQTESDSSSYCTFEDF